mmetsp:Transcript_215/g.817  ORF Transcript_215/g.817 Transcript_215/m.817 type:complete len:242 (-) Transcript_215:1015-1740(-)
MFPRARRSLVSPHPDLPAPSRVCTTWPSTWAPPWCSSRPTWPCSCAPPGGSGGDVRRWWTWCGARARRSARPGGRRSPRTRRVGVSAASFPRSWEPSSRASSSPRRAGRPWSRSRGPAGRRGSRPCRRCCANRPPRRWCGPKSPSWTFWWRGTSCATAGRAETCPTGTRWPCASWSGPAASCRTSSPKPSFWDNVGGGGGGRRGANRSAAVSDLAGGGTATGRRLHFVVVVVGNVFGFYFF